MWCEDFFSEGGARKKLTAAAFVCFFDLSQQSPPAETSKQKKPVISCSIFKRAVILYAA